MEDKLWYLSKISIFETLPAEDLQEIDRMAPMSHFNAVPKGTMIQTPGNEKDGLFFVKLGKLRLYKINEDGRQFTLGILGQGNMFGEIESFSLGTKGIYIETMEETLICSVLKDDFNHFLSQRPLLAMKFLKELSDRLQERDELLEKLALGDLKEKVLYLLVKLAEKFGIKDKEYMRIDIPLTHQELANMIGATRESVTLVLQELSKESLIQTGRMSIKVNLPKIGRVITLE